VDVFVEAIMSSGAASLPDVAELLRRPAWQKHAACRGMGVKDFFPPEGSSPLRAAAVCRRCPVAAECLQYALENPSLKGVWGGTSERARRRMRIALDSHLSESSEAS
jgi:Transcription factor WhiB